MTECTKGSAKKATQSTGKVDRSSSEHGERYSGSGNSGQGRIVILVTMGKMEISIYPFGCRRNAGAWDGVEQFDRKMFHKELPSVGRESVHVMKNRIHDIDEYHMNSTVTVFRDFGYNQPVWRINVTIHRLEFLLNGNG